MISPEEAWHELSSWSAPQRTETVSRLDSTGRVLAADLAATVDVPAFDVSAMDGFALCGDIAPETTLPVAGVLAAGDPPGRALPQDATLAIMTGAALPQGADRVIAVEQTRRSGESVTCLKSVPVGQHIRRRAEIQSSGELLLPVGSQITPGTLALLATHGISEATVFARPSVRLIVTGNEVVSPENRPRAGQLRDAHTDFLRTATRSVGLEAETLGIVRDDRDALAAAIARGLEADVLLLTGGVSMGEFDFVEEILEHHHCQVLFDKVAVQPGKPLVAARHDGGMVFGLPGNPASVMASFWLFVRPFLRNLLGAHDGFWVGALDAELAAPLPAAKGRDRFFACQVTSSAGKLLATPSLPKGSHDVLAYAAGTALVRAAAGNPAQGAGSRCQILPLANWLAEKHPQ